MDEYLVQFLLNKRSRLLIQFPCDDDNWWSFYLDLKKCGWEFTSPLDISSKLDGSFLIWIKSDQTLWFTSLSANEKYLTPSEFKRNYNLFILFNTL